MQHLDENLVKSKTSENSYTEHHFRGCILKPPPSIFYIKKLHTIYFEGVL